MGGAFSGVVWRGGVEWLRSARLEDCAVSLWDITALRRGFDLLKGLGGMAAVQVGVGGGQLLLGYGSEGRLCWWGLGVRGGEAVLRGW